jgi:hypothetical protein
VAAILLIANAAFVWTTGTRLEQQLAEIRNAGDPLSLADLARKPIPPETNAATYLRRAEPEAAAIETEFGQWIEKMGNDNNLDLLSYYGDFFGQKGPVPEKMRKAMTAIYAAHPKAIELLQQAANCPDYDPQLDFSLSPEQLISQLLPVVQGLRGDARVLCYRARLLETDGNSNEAARLAIATFRLARHFERNPILVSYLVALTIQDMATNVANRALQVGPVSQEVRQALDVELALQEPMEGYMRAIKSDRAFGLDSFQALPLRNFWLYRRGSCNREESRYLDALAAYLAVAPGCRSYHTSNLTVDKATGKVSGGSFPSLDATHVATTRERAMIRCLRVLNALQSHVSAESKETPKLADLGLPAETTTDPFAAGKPLHIKRLAQGWLVYSVGPNGQDDGGKVEDPQNGDVGIAPLTPTKADEPAKK